MHGLFTTEVLIPLGGSASAGIATVRGSLFILRMNKTNSHYLTLALA